MANNRQKAKARQARRREGQGGDREPTPQLSESEAIRAGVPPVDAGQAGSGVVDPGVEEIEQDPNHFDPEIDETPDGEDLVTSGPRGQRGGHEAEAASGSRVVQFLRSVIAELKRVQWPTRDQLITLTGVVLGFVVVAGLYLGGLDYISGQIIKAIL